MSGPREPRKAEKSSDSIDGISAYFLELERLIDRVHNSSNQYQVLGVDRNADIEKIKRAYRVAIRLLKPTGIDPDIPELLKSKMERTHGRVLQAFSTLSNIGKRIAYDNTLVKRTAPLLVDLSGANEIKPRPNPISDDTPTASPPGKPCTPVLPMGESDRSKRQTPPLTEATTKSNGDRNRRRSTVPELHRQRVGGD